MRISIKTRDRFCSASLIVCEGLMANARMFAIAESTRDIGMRP